jgi:hypothetical protein
MKPVILFAPKQPGKNGGPKKDTRNYEHAPTARHSLRIITKGKLTKGTPK